MVFDAPVDLVDDQLDLAPPFVHCFVHPVSTGPATIIGSRRAFAAWIWICCFVFAAALFCVLARFMLEWEKTQNAGGKSRDARKQKHGTRRGLSGSALKWIAIVTMLIDHTGAVVIEQGALEWAGLVLRTLHCG